MQTSYFRHPLWKKFQGRQIYVLCASDTEHRLRDAKAIMRLRDFLPPSESGMCVYAISTVHSHGRAIWPASKIPPEAGVIILGRPALFSAQTFMDQCRPKLGYSFESDRPEESTKYRTIITEGLERARFKCPLFATQLRVRPAPKSLYDYGLVYSGWRSHKADGQCRPVMLLAGTSTLGTWGAVRYVTEEVPPYDVRWQDDIQGIVRAQAENTPEAFEDVEAAPLRGEMLSPCRIWIEGGHLPHRSREAWDLASQRSYTDLEKNCTLDLRILVNGQEIMAHQRTFMPALVLLALANNKVQDLYPGGYSCKATAADVLATVRKFLTVQPSTQHIYVTLNSLIRQIRGAGGIAYVERTREGPKGGPTFYLVLRPLPFFLPTM